MNRPILRTAVFATMFALGLAANAAAEQLVTFTRGHSIVVLSSEKRGNWYYFALEGGGEMGVPVNQVARMEEYEPPPNALPAGQAAAQEPPRVTATPTPPSAAPSANGSNPSAPANDASAVNPAATNQIPPPGAKGAEVPQADDDWRTKVKMGGGRSQAGGSRKPGGMGGWGANRLQGGQGNANPYNRRPPNQPPQQPPAQPQQ